MTLEQAIKGQLATVLPGIPAYPGNRPATAALPALEYDVSPDMPTHLDGADGTSQAEVIVRVMGPTLAACETMADALRAGLSTRGASWSGLTIDAAWCDSESDIASDLRTGGESWLYEIDQTYLVEYRP